MDTTDDEIIATCLTPEIHKLNEKLTKEHRSQATEAEFLGAFEIAMRNMIKEAKAEGYKEGKADTAKQIFKKFEDKVIFIRGDNEDIGIYLSSAKNYFTLKKEFNIEE